MMQYTLNGHRKVDLLTDVAIARLREHEPEEGYHLSFSGGKDSIVIYDLAVRAGVKFDAHYNDITVDPPELREFIRDHYPDVTWDRPRRSMYELIRHKHFLPSRIARYCCSELKGWNGGGRVVVIGVRAAESVARRSRKVFEESRIRPKKWFLSPILDWATQDVWDYIRDQNLPYCSLYDEGWDRLGCIMCPMQGTSGMIRDARRYPEHYEKYMQAITDMLVGSNGQRFYSKYGSSPEQIMHWWIHNSALDTETRQADLLSGALL